jgi:hypothetical protein
MKGFQVLLCCTLLCRVVSAADMPGAYFPLLDAGAAKVEKRLADQPGADLAALESRPGWRHFPYAILAPAVLYSQKHPDNKRYHDPAMLSLATRIGDLLASENEKGRFQPRLDSDWDTYMWIEAYRLLEPDLGKERQERWKREILKNVALLVPDTVERLDFPWYHSPFIGTSPNHFSQWASILHFAAKVFGNPEWEQLGARILRRFAQVEQSADGYWGEHNNSGPTPGYNHLTLTALALYYEYSKDPDVLPALRKATDFHIHCTYPDGTVVELLNDRNRYWEVSAWGQFAFTNFPEGRRYAQFLTGFFRPDTLEVDDLGRLAQDALYYHTGPMKPIPQDQPRYSWRMNVPAGIRKTGPWTVALSGIMSTQAINNQFYLDRQSALSVFNEKLGLIISGANSKRQPELATFSETIEGRTYHMPVSTRLQMSDTVDRLSLAYNTFWTDLYVPSPSPEELSLKFAIVGKGSPSDNPRLTLQLCLKPGERLETGAGKVFTLGTELIELGPEDLGGSIRHHGWTLKLDPSARLVWPVYPFNPYANALEKTLDHAVGALSVPLTLKDGRYIRPGEQTINFVLSTR